MIRRSSIKQSLVTAGVFGLLAAIMIAPLSNANYAPDNADFFNHLAAIVQAHIALMQGQFPLRDALLNAFNLRYPFFQFYSPTTYLITSVIYHLSGTQNPIVTYEFTLWLWMVIGACYLFRLGCWLFASRAIAYVVGVVFITSPYFITVNNHLFGFNEGIALSIIPIVLFYLIQSISLPTRLSSVVALSLAIYLLITTHLITFVNTTLIVSILLVAMSLKKQLSTRSLLNIFAAYLFACLLAAWYLAPIALLSHALIAAQSFSDPELFQSRHPPLLGLLSFTSNYLLGNDAQTTVKIIPAIGWPILLSFFICVNYLTKTQLLVRHQRAQQWLPYLIVTFSICFLLAWSPINIWKYLPSQLRVSEYSWRLLGQLSWLGALLAGYAISWYAKTKLSRIKAGVCIALLLCIANSWLTIIDNKFVPLSKAFVSDPKLLFNTSAYLIDTKKHPEFISHIDNVVLDSLYSGNILKLNTPYHIPQALMSYTVSPAIDLQLTISKAPEQLQLYVLLNKKIIKRIPMLVGKLQQHVLIEKSQLKPNSDNSIEIQFSAPLKNASDLDMHIASIVLTGFYDPKALMNIDLTEKYCSSKQTIVTCSIPTTQSTRLIELPMHYFPALLDVKLNGQRIAYEGILRNGYVLTVITPEAGKVNEITLQMIGLTWANWLSRMSWGLLLCAMLYLLIQKLSNYFRFRFN